MQTMKTVAATAVSCFGLYLGYRRFLLKEGINIRGTWISTSSIACEGSFVSRVTLENRKDRAVTIYGMYLRVGHNIYVHLHDFGDDPLILKGFETFQKDYDPIEFYALNARRVDIDPLLRDRTLSQRLVLSTSHGKYVVRKLIKHWDPVHIYFDNHLTGLIRPIRATYNGLGYGGNARFLIHFKSKDGSENVVPIYPSDFRVRKFRDFRLTEDSLSSKEALESHLSSERDKGTLKSVSFEVHDAEVMRRQSFEFYREDTVTLPKVGRFHYFVIGPLITRWSNWNMRRENKRRAKQLAVQAGFINTRSAVAQPTNGASFHQAGPSPQKGECSPSFPNADESSLKVPGNGVNANSKSDSGPS